MKLSADGDGERQDETALLDGCMKGNPARHAFTGAQRIIHHVRWQHPSKFVKYRAEQREEKKRLLLREVRRVTMELHAQGVYPSQVRVRNLLDRSWSIRVPEALAMWHATLKELGLEEQEAKTPMKSRTIKLPGQIE